MIEVVERESGIKLGETLEDLVKNSEVEEALADVREGKEAVKLEDIIDEETVETIKPVIEQDIEPKSYNHASYDVEAYAGRESYKSDYKPADVQINESSASYSVVANDHKLMKEANEINKSARDNRMMGRIDFEAVISTRHAHVKEQIKLRSAVMWYLMYDGVQFN